MPKRHRARKLNSPQIFLLAAVVGAVVALLLQFAASLPPANTLPAVDKSRLVNIMQPDLPAS